MNLEDGLIMLLEGNTWRIYTFYIYLKWEHLLKQHHIWNHSIILLEILLKMNSYNGKKVRVPRTRTMLKFTRTDRTDSLFRSVKDFLKNTADFPMQFDESLLFQDERAENLKNEFRIRFKNVTSIIDCAACEKCRLWGKLQTHGLGTALKVCSKLGCPGF